MIKRFFHKKSILVIGCVILLGTIISGVCLTMQITSSKKTDTTVADNYPNDFNFRLNYDTLGRDQVDTYKGTFTKDLVIDGTKTFNFAIPEEMKKKIYDLMMEIDIMSFPESLEANCMQAKPPCDYDFTVTMNGLTKRIVWPDAMSTHDTENLPKYQADFLRLVKFISDYICSTDEYKKMPKANGGYE